MRNPPFFSDPAMDALMGSMLAAATWHLLLSARQHRLSRSMAAGDAQADLDAPLTAAEREWVRVQADQLVAGWLDPFLGTAPPAVSPVGDGLATRAPRSRASGTPAGRSATGRS